VWPSKCQFSASGVGAFRSNGSGAITGDETVMLLHNLVMIFLLAEVVISFLQSVGRGH
jgi:hypothetical protein